MSMPEDRQFSSSETDSGASASSSETSARWGTIATASSRKVVGGRERLDDEERVAAGPRVQRVRVDARRLCERGNRVGRQRGEPHALDRCACRELAQHAAQRMARLQLVVAVRRHDHGRHVRETAGEEPQHVEGRLVGPVDVLEHEDRRPPGAQLGDERRGHLVRDGFSGHDVFQRTAGLLGDRQQRA
jgi:hypothetical protein